MAETSDFSVVYLGEQIGKSDKNQPPAPIKPVPINEPSQQVPKPAQGAHAPDTLQMIKSNDPSNKDGDLLKEGDVAIVYRPYKKNMQFASGNPQSGNYGKLDTSALTDKEDIHYQPGDYNAPGNLKFRYSYFELFGTDYYDLSAPDAEASRWTPQGVQRVAKSIPGSGSTQKWSAVDNQDYYGLWGSNSQQASNYYEAKKQGLMNTDRYVYFSRPLNLKNQQDFLAQSQWDYSMNPRNKALLKVRPPKRRLKDLENPPTLEQEKKIKLANEIPHIPPNENDAHAYDFTNDQFIENWNGQDWYGRKNNNIPRTPGRRYIDEDAYHERMNQIVGEDDRFEEVDLNNAIIQPIERPKVADDFPSGHQPMDQDPGKKRKNSIPLPPKPKGPPPQPPKSVPPQLPKPAPPQIPPRPPRPLPPPPPVIPVNHNPVHGGVVAGNEPRLGLGVANHIFYPNTVKIYVRNKKRKHKRGYNKYF